MVSPYARQNSVSSALIDQSSVVKFIEHNWNVPAMSNGAADAAAGSLGSLFDFKGQPARPLYLDSSTGEPVGANGASGQGY